MRLQPMELCAASNREKRVRFEPIATIRPILTAMAAAVLMLGAGTPASAEGDGEWRHASALAGPPKYPADFPHFDYVNPDAPRGGAVRMSQTGTFDTVNPILEKGVAAAGLGLVYETLMVSAYDELDISAEYGLLAEAMRYPDDISSVTYRLRAEARWADGTPVTPEDVVWSFDKTKELDPTQRFYYLHVVKAEKTGDREVTFTFDETGNRELPHIVGQLTVLPKHWWEGTGPDGKPRDVASSSLEPPMGSGPYRVSRVEAGRIITYERNPDYWGRELPVRIGTNNFDTIQFEYYRDRTVEFEAFKADKIDYWSENEARRWATGYDFPAARDGRVKQELIEQAQVSGSMVGFIPNLRRDQFKDPRVRQALNYAFDFEELNRTIFFGQYERIDSFFYGIPLRWNGLPEGKELEILETVRDQVPPEVFTTPYVNPVGGDPGKLRDNLRKAVDLLTQAGYRLDGRTMVGPDGKPLAFELLLNGPTLERVALPYKQWLSRIGIDMSVRTVDSNQYISRLRARDFDMTYTGWGQSMSPGNEQFDYWGSAAADSESSRNWAGIKDPAVDALIQRVVFAKDRDELVAATRALDRVLMANQYVIPSYTIQKDRIAYWDRFGHPDPLPKFVVGFPDVWWWDADKAARTGGGG
jgi:microcin C transport system substrate-binding protein